MKITIKYNGAYPNLCSGNLIVTVTHENPHFEEEFDFGSHVLSSGGGVSFDENWSEHVSSGPWSITDWPEAFPENYKEELLEIINSEIDHGCCGGCV